MVTKNTDPNPFSDPYNNIDSLCDPDMYGTLQWAVRKANDAISPSRIEFNIPGTGIHEIELQSFLPQIIKPVELDATSQPGYQPGNCAIIINGQGKFKSCFEIYNATVSISGFEITGFVTNAIWLNSSPNSLIHNNKVILSSNSSIFSYAIGFAMSDNVTVKGNIISNVQTSDSINSYYGMYIKYSNYGVIGDTTTNGANHISNCVAGILLAQSQKVRISGNSIFNNNTAILLMNGSNNNILPPVILSYANGILSGTAEPNSTIEIFGSTGPENANEYLASTVADGSGEWSWNAQYSNNSNCIISTNTDQNHNTSSLSTQFYLISNNGDSCETAIYFDIDTVIDNSLFALNETQSLWLKFTAEYSSLQIFPRSYSLNEQIQFSSMSLFNGNCNQLNLLSNVTSNDSIFFQYNDLQIGDDYFVKISVNSNDSSTEFYLNALYIKEISLTNCPASCDNFIPNPNFSIANNVDGSNPFMLDVCGWSCAWGSPQIINTTFGNSAHMWSRRQSTTENIIWGEGIFTDIHLCQGETYEISLSYLANLTFQSLTIAFCMNNSYVPSPVPVNGSVVPPITNSQQIVINPLATEWVNISFTFVADNDYEQLLIFPFQNSINQLWVAVDNLKLRRISANAGENIEICQNHPEQLNATGCNNHSYNWSPPLGLSNTTIMNPWANPSSNTTYTLTITDVNGCTATDQVNVWVKPNPNVTASSSPLSVCNTSDNISLNAIANNGTPPYIYFWNNGIGYGQQHMVSQNSTTTYIVTVTDNNGCTASDDITVNTYQAPTLHISAAPHPPCNSGLIDVFLNASGGTQPSSYFWSNNASTQNLIGVSPGTYTVTVYYGYFCSTTASITYNYENLILSEINVHNPCYPLNNGSINVSIHGGTFPYYYHWEDSYGNNIGSNSPAISGLSDGEYFLTVTDAAGCTLNIHQMLQFVTPPNIIVNLISDNCSGDNPNGSAEVVVDNGISNYTYLWSNGETNSIATHLLGGTNYVTVTDDNGCIATGSILLHEFNTNSQFHHISECLNLTAIQNSSQFFAPDEIPVDWEEYEYYWDFGNGSFSSDLFPLIDYQWEGYYCPQLTVSRGNCMSSTQHRVYVQPSICYCNELNFDVSSETIFTDTQWDGVVKYILHDLTINPNVTLTLKNCILHFGPSGRLIVSEGAKLISLAATFTSFELEPDCDHMWQGIEVYGTPGNESASGSVVISEPSIIKNAHIGVLLGKRNMEFSCSQLNSNFNPYITSSSGGQLFISSENVFFENNGTDIRFVEPPVGTCLHSSTINYAHFVCTAPLLDFGYNTSHPDPYGYGISPIGFNGSVNPRNPWAGRANAQQRSDAAIWINKRKNVSINCSYFENKDKCILSFDSRYNVYKSIFYNAIFGIKICNTTSSFTNAHIISECKFDMIPGLPNVKGACIHILGGRNDYIHDNTFGNDDSQQNLSYDGIFTSGTSGFKIVENDFYNYMYGIRVFNSGYFGGFIGAGISTTHDNWRGNQFFVNRINIETRDNNSRLKLRCNLCYNPNPLLFVTNFNNSGQLANQGQTIPNSIPSGVNIQQYLAGNDFTDNNPNPLPIARYISTTGNTYNYYHHQNIKTTPVNGNTMGFITTPVNIYNSGIPKTTNTAACPPVQTIIVDPDSDLDISLSSLLLNSINEFNSQISQLEQTYSNIEDILDNGKTAELLNDIYNRAPNGKLTSKLLANSPLSDTVLLALLIEYPISHGNFKNVMQRNMPVSKDVELYLLERLNTLPIGIYNQLINLQAYNPQFITLTSINNEINYLKLELQGIIIDLFIQLNDTMINRPDLVPNLLTFDNTNSSRQAIASGNIVEGNLNLAIAELQNLEFVSEEDSNWLEMSEIIVNLYLQGKSFHEMNVEQLNTIREMAYKCPEEISTANAKSILYFLFGEEVPECEAMLAKASKSRIKELQFVLPETDAYVEENFPNPVFNETYINYYLPEESQGMLIFVDILGQVVATFELISGEHTFVFNTTALSQGIYSYAYVVDNKTIDCKKMVIVR